MQSTVYLYCQLILSLLNLLVMPTRLKKDVVADLFKAEGIDSYPDLKEYIAGVVEANTIGGRTDFNRVKDELLAIAKLIKSAAKNIQKVN